jgi:hypothetical protein
MRILAPDPSAAARKRIVSERSVPSTYFGAVLPISGRIVFAVMRICSV